MLDGETMSYAEAAEVLKLRYATTITDLVEKAEITPKPMRHNAMAKGLDRNDMRKLREMLGLTGRVAATA